MNLHFLGGADEVGASCTLIEIEGQRILVDAGIRMGAQQGSHLPNFSVLDDVGKPDDVLITHAHTDHTGALPVLASALGPSARLLCTPATKAITRVLLSDALKIMSIKEESEGELPLYPPEATGGVLAKMQDVPWLTTVPICDGKLRACWIPSGHILGAASIYIEGQRESLLMSGDLSVANQRTIPGMTIPHCRPDVVVLESTYGNRQHADRDQQERALADKVAQVIERGGKVLIPAFAVGRSQEVLLILAKAMRDKIIPSFPVFADGMVRSVNAVYAGFGEELANPVRRRITKGEDPFYNDWVGAVSVPADRERVLAGPPCCIVASSGMLVGGASSYYAERLVSEPNNLIAITGYQDEESPGRALLDLTRTTAEDRTLMLNGQARPVSCAVESYSLSAHADAGELTALVRRLNPRTVCLVHGEPEARVALAESLDTFLPDGAQMPDNGSCFFFTAGDQRRTKGYGRSIPRGGIGGGSDPTEESLKTIRDYLVETGARGALRIQEISEVWFGSEGADVERVEQFRTLLRSGQRAFRPDFRRPFLFHLSSKDDAPVDVKMEMNAARDRIVTTLPFEAGLIKCSAHVGDGVYELAVHFPDVVRDRFCDLLAELETEIGWTLKIRDTPHQGRLFEEALHCLPEQATAQKSPALRLERKEVLLHVRVPDSLRAEWETLAKTAIDAYRECTGFTLILADDSGPKRSLECKAPSDALEINRAYRVVKAAFEEEDHAPYRVGLKSDHEGAFIEVTFISPSVGEWYRSKLDALTDETGWPIRVRQSANQEHIALEASRITPDACGVRGTPKFYPGEWRVVVPVNKLPRAVDREALTKAFEMATGCAIDWTVPNVT
ncbi:MAG: hypothetical protein CME19_22520 [Gemmatimonadetes bacterium]|nr:hypothetical protein [Gemmatimonadota bacterium]